MLYPGERDSGGCAISGMMSESGLPFPGDAIIRSIAVMRERSSGLGGGFVGYGIYPEHASLYAFHLILDHGAAEEAARAFLEANCAIVREEPIPTRPLPEISRRPILRRWFLGLKPELRERYYDETEEDIVVRLVMHINREIDGAFVMSSGKNMGIFKGVGYPEDIGRFFMLEDYRAHTWLAHGRFPTNTTSWWGGAHPFGLLDWAVVHNGEISSYMVNRRYLENFGYHCTLHTDTEVICYLCDLLMRKHALPVEVASRVLAPPFWTSIERLPAGEKEEARTLRMVYAGALLNGPFSIVVGHSRGLIGLNDRTKLRPMTAARSGDMLYLASEESAIQAVCPSPDRVWRPRAGEPVIGVTRMPDA